MKKGRMVCPKTMSGEHIWEEAHWTGFRGRSFYWFKRCKACKIIDDTKKGE